MPPARRPSFAARVTTPLMRLRDPAFTRIFLVTLPETTPVSEAERLQEDLRRAGIEPWAWVVNASLVTSGTRDPLLRHRIALERRQIERVRAGLARRLAIVPLRPFEPRGVDALRAGRRRQRPMTSARPARRTERARRVTAPP
jgi:arsenite-transporting ATPase